MTDIKIEPRKRRQVLCRIRLPWLHRHRVVWTELLCTSVPTAGERRLQVLGWACFPPRKVDPGLWSEKGVQRAKNLSMHLLSNTGSENKTAGRSLRVPVFFHHSGDQTAKWLRAYTCPPELRTS